MKKESVYQRFISSSYSSCMRFSCMLVFLLISVSCTYAQQFLKITPEDSELDKKVKTFLKSHRGKWRDMNVPVSDGRLLYDIIVKNGYTKGIEIGTSTGHSTVWMAWAMSKTGGKIITLEIDETRYQEAMANFKEAGVADYIDARLTDAHQTVKTLEGPFDFAFNDADKNWYTNYFKALSPKITKGGCYTAHNVRPAGRRGMAGAQAYLDYVLTQEGFSTTVNNSGGGLAISYKK